MKQWFRAILWMTSFIWMEYREKAHHIKNSSLNWSIGLHFDSLVGRFNEVFEMMEDLQAWKYCILERWQSEFWKQVYQNSETPPENIAFVSIFSKWKCKNFVLDVFEY